MLKLHLILAISLTCFVACTASSLSTPLASDSDTDFCDDWLLSEETAVCIAVDDNSVLIQSTVEQVTASLLQISIVVDGTVFVTMDDTIRIISLEGRTFVGVQGQNRILSSRRIVTIPIVNDIAQSPSASELLGFDLLIDAQFLNDLPRPIDMLTIIPTVTPVPIVISTIISDGCTGVDTWRGEYIVVAGDTLNAIAQRFDLTLDELSEGNCLNNVSRITVGQILSVPIAENTVNLSQIIGFRADSYVIESGICTMLFWNVANVSTIYLDNNLVTENGSLEVCPEQTQSYTLFVTYADRSEAIRELTISVQE